MPYIKKEMRKIFDDEIDALISKLSEQDENKIDGCLNYIITKIINAVYAKEPNYFKLNRAIGVLEAVKQEFYRRRIAPYEDEKIKENGDVK